MPRVPKTKTTQFVTRSSFILHRGPSDQHIPATVYKSEKRSELVNEGYTIYGSSGDQWSDLTGFALARRSFKLPNPLYYIAWIQHMAVVFCVLVNDSDSLPWFLKTTFAWIGLFVVSFWPWTEIGKKVVSVKAYFLPHYPTNKLPVHVCKVKEAKRKYLTLFACYQ